MVRPLVAAASFTITVMVAFAAVPLEVSSHASTGASQIQPERRATSTGVVSGTVLDRDGAPLVRAVVAAEQRPGTWRGLTLTDANGAFRFEGVPAGSIVLTVRKGAVEFSDQLRVDASGATVTLTAPPTPGQGDLAGPPMGIVPMVAAPAPQEAVRGAARGVALGGGVGGPFGGGAYVGGARPIDPPTSMDRYARIDAPGFRTVGDAPLSTFSVDVDTASYTNTRRFLMEAQLPPVDAIRVEEWINYFPYDYAAPRADDVFQVSATVTSCPWNEAHRLLRVGVRGRPVPTTATPPRNLVFLVDVSGSMLSRDKLPLVKTSLRMLADELTARDRLAIVVYAGRTEVVLPSTPGDQRARIQAALERLEAGGSTNGAGGIQLAYRAARDGFIRGGVNRVVLATDGDFNVGVTSFGDLTRIIEQERASGVFLSVLGVGRGNLKDDTLEALADRGNGQYAYIDSLQEARRVLIEQIGATLVTIAKDVKLQVEFNPRHVASYRLIGYENRTLQTEDFADDRKDAGEIGAGHTVTALYEVVPVGTAVHVGGTPLRYQPRQATPTVAGADELATVSVRHKAPDGEASVLRTHPVGARVVSADGETAFASAVAEAALALRRDAHAPGASVAAATTRAARALGSDPGGWRAEFVRLMQLAVALQSQQPSPTNPE